MEGKEDHSNFISEKFNLNRVRSGINEVQEKLNIIDSNFFREPSSLFPNHNEYNQNVKEHHEGGGSVNYYNSSQNFNRTPNIINSHTILERISNESTSRANDTESRAETGRIANYIPPCCTPKLQNIVSTLNLKCQLDLREIALKSRNAEYNPKRFAAVIMRIREPKTTALIFASGKMVCTGARNEDDSRKASRQYAKIIRKLGFNVKFSEFKIQNIVGSSDVKFPIRLEGLASDHAKFCSYEPEMFPGLIYRMHVPKIVLLIFVSGKIVLTGAKDRDDIYKAFDSIYSVLLQYRKVDKNASSAVSSH